MGVKAEKYQKQVEKFEKKLVEAEKTRAKAEKARRKAEAKARASAAEAAKARAQAEAQARAAEAERLRIETERQAKAAEIARQTAQAEASRKAVQERELFERQKRIGLYKILEDMVSASDNVLYILENQIFPIMSTPFGANGRVSDAAFQPLMCALRDAKNSNSIARASQIATSGPGRATVDLAQTTLNSLYRVRQAVISAGDSGRSILCQHLDEAISEAQRAANTANAAIRF